MTIIRMPQLGESVVEGTIGKWLVAPGDAVSKDQPVVEILTDKADSEINAPDAGVVTKILAPEGALVTVGAALCEIGPAASGKAPAASAAAPRPGVVQPSASAAAASDIPAEQPAALGGDSHLPAEQPAALGGDSHLPAEQPAALGGPRESRLDSEAPRSSPAVRKLAREHGVDLVGVAGSGDGGRVTKDDVLRAASSSGASRAATTPVDVAPAAPAPSARATETPVVSSGAFRLPPYVARPGDEVVSMSRRRRIIADHMVYSKLTSPHVVTVAECDVHKTEALRKTHKDAWKREGVNLTFLAFVAAATARALRESRVMNARMLEDAYVLLAEINLGVAVDTPEGLVVPVIRNAADLSVRGLARAIDDIAIKARDGKLTPDDLAGKSFTISNPGRKGNLFGGAIISQPNVGILRTGEIKKRVVVVEHDGEDLMAIHPVMHMALSYDHRVVDGVAANTFLYRIREILETGEFAM